MRSLSCAVAAAMVGAWRKLVRDSATRRPSTALGQTQLFDHPERCSAPLPWGYRFTPKPTLSASMSKCACSQQLLEPVVLGLQVAQPLCLAGFHATETRAPLVERRVAEAALAA
jgi:hypothetical protein